MGKNTYSFVGRLSGSSANARSSPEDSNTKGCEHTAIYTGMYSNVPKYLLRSFIFVKSNN